MLIVIKHIDIEGPETLGAFFESQGFKINVCELYNGDHLPDNLSAVEAVVCLGGPMNVYEEDKYPFLKDVDTFIKKVLDERIPYLGICLGSQLLAKASGGRVVKSPVSEIGWFQVRLFENILFEGMPNPLDVFHWHGDMFELPPGGQLTATAEGCPHQALSVNGNAFGIQFHVEITDKSIREWTDRYFPKDDPSSQQQRQEMLDTYFNKQKIFNETARQMYRNFMRIINKDMARRKIISATGE